MRITYDPKKNEENIAARGLSFDRVEEIDWPNAIIQPDRRFAYGEERFQAYVMMEERLHMVAYTWRNATMRVISFRKANRKEIRKYAKKKS